MNSLYLATGRETEDQEPAPGHGTIRGWRPGAGFSPDGDRLGPGDPMRPREPERILHWTNLSGCPSPKSRRTLRSGLCRFYTRGSRGVQSGSCREGLYTVHCPLPGAGPLTTGASHQRGRGPSGLGSGCLGGHAPQGAQVWHEFPPVTHCWGAQWSIVPGAHLSQELMPGRCREGGVILPGSLPLASAEERGRQACDRVGGTGSDHCPHPRKPPKVAPERGGSPAGKGLSPSARPPTPLHPGTRWVGGASHPNFGGCERLQSAQP